MKINLTSWKSRRSDEIHKDFKNLKHLTNLCKSGKSKKYNDEPSGDGGIVIVDDDIVIDQEKINEERRAYLEEARSQEASD